MTGRGRFIVFEGGEATGKSTQARLLAATLGADLTREPGGTPLGEEIRRLLLTSEEAIEAPAEMMLMLAARAQHVSTRIRPALDAGRDVVCDRFSGSTFAYQSYGRGLDARAVTSADALARQGVAPDLVVLIDLEPAQAARRRSHRRDRIEREDDSFFARVRVGYAALAEADPAHWVVVDGAGTVEEVQHRVEDVVSARLSPSGEALSR